MHPVTRVLQVLAFLWVASEIALAIFTRARRRSAARRDAGSLAFLWSAIAAGVFAAINLQRVRTAAIPLPTPWLHGIGLVILIAGLVIRWTAIVTLGRFFTASVTVLEDHTLIRTGLYRRIRHPSYTGLLIAFLGVAVSYGNWLSLFALFLPVLAALLYRIHVEESALVAALGEDYVEYKKETKGLIPGLF